VPGLIKLGFNMSRGDVSCFDQGRLFGNIRTSAFYGDLPSGSGGRP
jgi:hypothetical protein